MVDFCPNCSEFGLVDRRCTSKLKLKPFYCLFWYYFRFCCFDEWHLEASNQLLKLVLMEGLSIRRSIYWKTLLSCDDVVFWNSVSGRSRLHLLDLGSCETDISRTREGGGGQCLSLSALGNVVLALANGAKHVPYRYQLTLPAS